MAPSKENTKPNSREERVDFRDVQPLLRKSLGCEQLQVIDYTATKLLPLGENYCSVMVKLDVTIRRTASAKEEKLYFVAKTINRIERPIVTWAEVLRKEVFMYANLVPAYKSLEKEMGIEESEILDALPKYIGHRINLNESSSETDDYSLLLMENLKARDFYTCNRLVGLDFQHSKKALVSLARYHALGITLKHKRPDFFEKAVAHAQIYGIDFDQLDEGFDSVFKNIQENECFNKHLAKIEACFANSKGGGTIMVVPSKPWSTITHGDFWVNNMLFHKNERGDIDDVKFVDFQTYLFNSPLKDLPYFLCGSLDDETFTNHFDDLLNLYYETFLSSLKRGGCDVAPFARDSFLRELKRQALNEFPLCALAIKFFVFDANQNQAQDSGELMSNVFESKISDAYRDRLLRLIGVYEKRGWF